MSDYAKAIWIPNSNYFANTGKKRHWERIPSSQCLEISTADRLQATHVGAYHAS